MNLRAIDRKLKERQRQKSPQGENNWPTLEQWLTGTVDADTAAIYEARRAQARKALLDFGEDIEQ